MRHTHLTVLITGVASGIGRATAAALLSAGHTVIGLDRILPAPPAEGDFRPYQADVTSNEELTRVCDALGQAGILLDAIVCVAGIHDMVALTESDSLRLRRLVDVNLLGTVLTVRALHARLAPHGRIVIVTSEVAGLDPLPFNGMYSVTKRALDAYAQALRQECALLGQRVVTVRPGAIATPLAEGSLRATEELAAHTNLFREEAGRFLGVTRRFMGKPKRPEAIANTMVAAITARRPRLTYSRFFNPGLVLLSLLPLSWQCGVVGLLLHKKKKK